MPKSKKRLLHKSKLNSGRASKSQRGGIEKNRDLLTPAGALGSFAEVAQGMIPSHLLQLSGGELQNAQKISLARKMGQLKGNKRFGSVIASSDHSVQRTSEADQRSQQMTQTTSPLSNEKTIQRWGSKEHMQYGDVTKLRIDIGDGVELTFGQVIALAGDEFGTLGELMAATKTPDGRAMIRAHLERAEIPGTAAALLPPPTSAQKKQASGEYIKLAMNNISHFAAGGSAVENWLQKHAEAVDLAIEAGLYKDGGLLNQAYMTEAFGQHFLTDAFSGGHIRVPREEIQDYYVNDFAPRVFDHLIDHLRDRLIDEIYDQIDEQTVINEAAWVIGFPLGGLTLRKYIRERIENKINGMLDLAFAAAGGRAEAIKYVGMGLAGVVSGAMHDMENRNGLWVISDFDPVPWQAYGDGSKDKVENETNRLKVEEAVRASVADVQTAYSLGFEEGQTLYNIVEPKWVPEKVYFGFDKDVLSQEAGNTVDAVADFLNYNPATRLRLIGHADPIGDNPYNDDLGSRRSHSVANRLIGKGVNPTRIEVESKGESIPVTRDRRQYHLNRRVEFVYSTDATIPDDGADQVALENARQMTLNRVGPPYLAQGYLPRAADGLNSELPEWHWGAIPAQFQTEMANWIKGYAKEYGQDALKTDALNDMEEDTPIGKFTISPRPIAERILNEIMADPIKFLGSALGRKAK